MVNNESICVFSQTADLIFEVRIAGNIDLEKLVFVYKVFGDFLQVLICSPVLFFGVSEQQCTFFMREATNLCQLISALYRFDRDVKERVND